MIKFNILFRLPFLLMAYFSALYCLAAQEQASGLVKKPLEITGLYKGGFSEWNKPKSVSTITQAPVFKPLSQGIFLPRWSAETLPFFCKIEHDWVKKNGRIPMKFRLGSVEYVDWLEGKSPLP